MITPDSPVHNVEFDAGLTDDEVDAVEAPFAFRFPPDLRAFLQTALPKGPNFPEWRSGDEDEIRERLDLPRQGVLFDVEHDGFRQAEWGPRPASIVEAVRRAGELVSAAPKLIPIFGHRMMPDEPNLSGNPVFSVHRTDIIHYGFDLADYFRQEFDLPGREKRPEVVRPIRFRDVDRFQDVRWRPSMWTIRREPLDGERLHRYVVDRDGVDATFGEVVDAWREDAGFRSLFNETLAESPFAAFRWETPSVSTSSLSRRFEFVLLDEPGLDRRPDPKAFAEHFDGRPGSEAVAFSNLGGDAVMVVPCPNAAPTTYGHLAVFVREAPAQQRDAFWRLVGEDIERRIGVKPVWLSTAGAGVSWLHVRLDDRPKYYGFDPYRSTERT